MNREMSVGMPLYRDSEGARLRRIELKNRNRKGYRDGIIIIGVSFLLFLVIMLGGLAKGENLFLVSKRFWAWLIFSLTFSYGCWEILLSMFATHEIGALEVYEDHISVPWMNIFCTKSRAKEIPLEEISQIVLEVRESRIIRFELRGMNFRRMRADPLMITDIDAFEKSLRGKVEVIRVELPSLG